MSLFHEQARQTEIDKDTEKDKKTIQRCTTFYSETYTIQHARRDRQSTENFYPVCVARPCKAIYKVISGRVPTVDWG